MGGSRHRHSEEGLAQLEPSLHASLGALWVQMVMPGMTKWPGQGSARTARPAGRDFLPQHAPAGLPRRSRTHEWGGGEGLPLLSLLPVAPECSCYLSRPWATGPDPHMDHVSQPVLLSPPPPRVVVGWRAAGSWGRLCILIPAGLADPGQWLAGGVGASSRGRTAVLGLYRRLSGQQESGEPGPGLAPQPTALCPMWPRRAAALPCAPGGLPGGHTSPLSNLCRITDGLSLPPLMAKLGLAAAGGVATVPVTPASP